MYLVENISQRRREILPRLIMTLGKEMDGADEEINVQIRDKQHISSTAALVISLGASRGTQIHVRRFIHPAIHLLLSRN